MGLAASDFCRLRAFWRQLALAVDQLALLINTATVRSPSL